MDKKGDLSDFGLGVAVGARFGLSMLETADLLLNTTISWVYRQQSVKKISSEQQFSDARGEWPQLNNHSLPPKYAEDDLTMH